MRVSEDRQTSGTISGLRSVRGANHDVPSDRSSNGRTGDHSRRPKNVFVLSGGGSRGAAQVGMLRALLRAGITPDAIAAGSVGALNAVAFASEPNQAGVEALAGHWLSVRASDVARTHVFDMARNLLLRRPHLGSSAPLGEMARRWTSATRLEELALPVRVVTTCLDTGRAAYHDRGDLASLVRASAAIPGLFEPIELPHPTTGEPTMHVDAGLSELIPLQAAAGLDPTRVYVLDVSKRPTYTRLCNPLQVIAASCGAAVHSRPLHQLPADVVVTHITCDPSLDSGGILDFDCSAELIAAGERAVFEALTTEACVAMAS